MTMRLSIRSFAGTVRTLVAVGTARLASMFVTTRAAGPLIRTTTAGSFGAVEADDVSRAAEGRDDDGPEGLRGVSGGTWVARAAPGRGPPGWRAPGRGPRGWRAPGRTARGPRALARRRSPPAVEPPGPSSGGSRRRRATRPCRPSSGRPGTARRARRPAIRWHRTRVLGGGRWVTRSRLLPVTARRHQLLATVPVPSGRGQVRSGSRDRPPPVRGGRLRPTGHAHLPVGTRFPAMTKVTDEVLGSPRAGARPDLLRRLPDTLPFPGRLPARRRPVAAATGPGRRSRWSSRT